MHLRPATKLLPGLLLALLLAGTALAGGVIVELDTPLPTAKAGEPFTVEFTIRSAHDGSLQSGMQPFITATDAQTGEALTFQAASLDEPGRYTASLTLPRAGEWRWQVHPWEEYPREAIAALPPLQVQPAAGAGAASFSALASPGLLWMAAITLALLAFGVWVIARRRLPVPRA